MESCWRSSAGRTIWPLLEIRVFIMVRYRLTKLQGNRISPNSPQKAPRATRTWPEDNGEDGDADYPTRAVIALALSPAMAVGRLRLSRIWVAGSNPIAL